MSEEAKRETWRDWVLWDEGWDEPLMLTRQEAIDTANRLGLKPPLDARTMRYWETVGIIPRPTLDYTSDGPRARYPWWIVDLVWQARRYQDAGLTNKQLPGRMRSSARRLARVHWPRPSSSPPARPDASDPAALLAYELRAVGPIEALSPPFEPLALPPEMRVRLNEWLEGLGQSLAMLHGITPTHAEIRLVTANGDSVTFRVPPEGESWDLAEFESW